MPDPLPVALMAWAAGNRPRDNAQRIITDIDAAAASGAKILLAPECCLTGYPSASRGDLSGIDWRELAVLEGQLLMHAERRGMLLVFGSAERSERGCTNDAVVGGVVPPARYRKRCLTPTDRGHFVPGSTPLLVDAFGWRLGVAICYDLRFAPAFYDLATAGADAFLVISHMAGPDPDPGTKAEVIPQLVATRAAEWATPLVFCNTAEPNRYCDSAVIDVRGRRIATTGEGLCTATLKHRDAFDPWYANLRVEHLERWSSHRVTPHS